MATDDRVPLMDLTSCGGHVNNTRLNKINIECVITRRIQHMLQILPFAVYIYT